MQFALSNLNSDMLKEHPNYIVRITSSDDFGKSQLDYFKSVSEKYPVIATTSKLLSTGVDCPMVKLIVLDQNISSMTEFKQIIGRGTRLRVDEGKTNFTIMDFRKVTRLFADPDWDGDPETYTPPTVLPPGPPWPPGPPKPPKPPKRYKPIVDAVGCDVEIIGKEVSIYDTNGQLLRKENIIDYTKTNIKWEYASLENFIKQWSGEKKKEKIKAMFADHGIDLDKLKRDQNMTTVDDFDFICHVAYDKKPLTRKERANNVKKRDFLSKYSGVAREILEALLDRYMNFGIYEIENMKVLKLEPFNKYGTVSKITKEYFGGKDGYLKAVQDMEYEIYLAG